MSARMVRTVEGIPRDGYLLDGNGNLCAIVSGGYYVAGLAGMRTLSKIPLPATVLAPAIDPDDEALVEKVARAAFLADNRGRRTAAAEWDNLTMIPPVYESYRAIAHAALKAVAQ